jgi:N-succinyldiaminopimelate aminotransferase
MNPLLDELQPYPFERFNALLDGVKSSASQPLIAWSLGEPRHEAPDFLVSQMQEGDIIRRGFGTYPPTRGLPELRESIAEFLARRYQLPRKPDPESQVLPVNGTREALFAFAQAVIDPAGGGITMMPNPFYQIYEGAALLAGTRPWFLNCTASNGFLPDFSTVPDSVWRDCRLLYICSPGNPTGAVMDIECLKQVVTLAQQHDFIVASDECYSEIYLDETMPPPGVLQAASELGLDGFDRCIAFNSLSKRSNLPGMRSGYVAGDADILAGFLKYRTYHGSAMPVHHQLLSTLAWQDDEHVLQNRRLYREKIFAVKAILDPVWPMDVPEAGFYFWPETPIPDQDLAVRLIELANVKVLPGSFLSRDTTTGNPGENRVRIALVATMQECVEAAERIAAVFSQVQSQP